MEIAYSKADWYNCRSCKSGYKNNWDEVQGIDKNINSFLKHILSGEKQATLSKFEDVIKHMDHNKSTLSEMRETWDKFRR